MSAMLKKSVLNLSPPVSVAGMIVLDRSAFHIVYKVPAIRINPKLCSHFLNRLQSKLLNQPRIANIRNDHKNSNRKVLLLRTDVQIDSLDPDELKFIRDNQGEHCWYNLEINYNYWNVKDILKAVLPSEIEPITSFETIGHIAHLNLRSEHQRYKSIIGQVLLDKNAHLKTVVNKVSEIVNQYRIAPLEVVAGNKCLITDVKENNCQFRFDYGEVYWNSRLHTEHNRLVSLLRPSQQIVDVFAGIGPFAIPAAKKGCIVHANDLNPACRDWLLINKKINKIKDKFYTYNMDGRDFIRMMIRDTQTKTDQSDTNQYAIDHIIMNLPAIAIEFLDVFRGIYVGLPATQETTSSTARKSQKLPRIHCYAFSKSEDRITDVKCRVESILCTSLKEGCYSVHDVRDVAPDKHMMCISFDLPEDVALHRSTDDNGELSYKSEQIHIL